MENKKQEALKIKKFVECFIPVKTCNFRCHYCYITQHRLFDTELPKFKHDAKIIAKALSKKRLGGTCMMNLCGGGETMLSPEVTDIVYEFLNEGHFVTVVTNGSVTKRFDEIIEFTKEYLDRLFFKFSFHYLELKRMNMLEKFFANIRKVRRAGCSVAVEITPNDELIPYIDEIKEVSMNEWGALPHITIARIDTAPNVPMLSKYSKEEFYDIWKVFKSPMLDFKIPVYGEKRNEHCMAGDWSFWVDLGDGHTTQCYGGESLGNIYENIGKPLYFKPIGKNCPLPHCFNAHSFLLWGDIPNFTDVTYANIRNRACNDGTQWLTPTMKEFMSSKLQEESIQE